MDERTRETRDAHDRLAPIYRERLAHILDEMPYERAVLGLFCEWVRLADGGADIGDLGCGTGRLSPYLRAQGLTPHGTDLSPEMIRAARADHPDVDFAVADTRELPFADASLAGALGWYSLMYLPAQERVRAFAEVARVVRPGGYLALAYKMGDDSARRGGHSLDPALGIGFDIWWHSPQEVADRVEHAGFEVAFWAGKPAAADELQPQGFLIARRTNSPASKPHSSSPRG